MSVCLDQWRRHGLKVAGDKREELGDFVPPSQKVGGMLYWRAKRAKKYFQRPPHFSVCPPPFWGGHTEKLGGTSKKCFRILYTINYQFSLPKQLTTWRHTYNPVHPMQPYGIREGRL